MGSIEETPQVNLKTVVKTLNDGTKMPILGLGTWQSKPKEVEEAVYHAICNSGYRHIDAAQIYGNQDEVGTGVNRALKDTGLKREDLWVTSKIWMVDFAPEDVGPAVDRILKDLQLEYVDQLLLHWPSVFDKPPKGSSPGNYPERWAGTEDPMFPKDKDGNLVFRDVPLSDTWKALMQEKKAGKVRSIGVSNFSAQEIKDMTKDGAEMPAVNQVEAHVFWNQKQLCEEMKELGVAVVAYSPLGNSGFHGEKSGITSDLVAEVAKDSGLTPAQVMLNYLINKDFIVIPKSVSPARIDGNGDWVPKLDDKQMAKLDAAPQKRLTDFPFRPGGKFFFSQENLKTMTRKLNDGTEMPILGLGTWQSKPKEVEEAVYHAICKTGYRHIDAAQIYGNQDEVGTGVNRALKDTGLKREDLWVTSKIWMVDFAPEDVGPAVDRILKDLQLEYVDQILLHWPSVFDKPPKGSSPGNYPEKWAGTEDPMFPKDKDGNLLHRDVPLSDTWKALMQEKKAGKVRSIGVSNFSAQEIKDMTEGGAEMPAVNQVEAHVFWNQEKLRKEMQELGVAVVAYSPLGNSGFHGEKSGITSDLVGEVAKESGLTPAQVMLNYLINKDFIVIPKSVTPARIDGNANWELKLNDKQMAKLDTAPQKRLTDFPFRPGGKFFFSQENLKTMTKRLNDGTEMPILGLGTWQSKPKEVEEAVYHAICKTGYRHIDAAQIYGNQDEVGTGVNRALKDTGLKREDLWVTSKIWMVDFAPEDVGPAVDRILKDLQLEYVDQILLHWPSVFDKPPKGSSPGNYPERWAGTEDPMFPKDKDGNLLHRDVPLSDTWKALMQEKKAGKVRSIGVSNFSTQEIKDMTEGGAEMPAVNQVEAHVFWNQEKLRKEMQELGVAVVAYSPLGNSGFHGEKSGITSDLVGEVAKESGLTPAQVMLNYLINKDFIVIPKSVTPARIDGNANWELKLNDKQMAKLETAPQKRLTDFPFRPGGKFFFSQENLKTMTKKLNDGTEMPILGLGTWQSKPKEVEEAVYHAICKTGYRHIDAAQIYGNQDEVGAGVNRALKDSGLKREDLWVTSKIWMVDFAPEDVGPAVDRILKDLQLEYVDQVLLHWPSVFDKPPKGSSPGNYPEKWAGTEDPMFPKDKDGNLLHRDVPLSDTWKALMQEKKAGKIRSIGVSNFSAQEIKDMTEGGAELPAVNQVEAHVFWNQEKLRKEMQELGVAVVAYSPLGNSGFHGEKSGISSDLVGEVAKESGLTPAQVMLNYLINKDFIVIPKSVTPARIDGNANWELKLNDKQMAKLDTAPQKRLTDFPFRPGGKFFFSEENNLKTMTKRLNDGTEMPILGLGTWQSKPKEVEEAVYHAICKTGYRHIDAAQIYGNQDEVGAGVSRALKDSGLKREDLWVTSKIWMVDFAPEDVGPAVDRILKDLQLEYVDQLLLHWPSVFDKPPKGSSPGNYPDKWAGTEDPMFPKDKDGNLLHRDVPLSETWKALMQEKKAGKVRSIGVSNFSAQEIKDMTQGGAEMPAVNQVEAHVFWNQEKLRKEMQELGVAVVAYSPLGNSGFHGEKSGISSDLVGEVAKESGLTPAQVMLNYLINKDFIVIPKSVTPARIDGNANWELKLNDKQMAKLDMAPQKRLTDFPFRPGGKFFFSEENNLKTMTKRLNDGTDMPIMGLGTWQSKPKEVEEAVYHAICKTGVRHIDAAQIYGNQDEVGTGVNRALKDTGLKREDLWVTSKVWMVDFAPEDVGPAIDRILKELQLEYVDQVLLHWPSCFDKPPKGSSPGNYPEKWAGTEDPMFPKDKDGNLLHRDVPLADTWAAMCKEKKAGKVRSIGVSNFSKAEIEEMTRGGLELPAVNQVEAHVFWNQSKLRKEMEELGVAVVAYSPLGNSGFHGEKSGISSDLVAEISKESGLTPAQVMLNYLINKGFIVIPKSVTPARIDGNANWELKLNDKQMAKLDAAPQKRLTDFPFRPGGKFFFDESEK